MAGLDPRPLARSPLASAEFRAVIGATLFIMFGFGLIVPTLPLFAKSFHVGEAGIGLVLTVFAATRLAADFFVGRAIDRLGERSVAAVGAAVVGLSSAAAGASPNFAWLVALRGVGGAGSALFLGALTAHLVGTVSPGERGRAMGAFQAVIQIGLLGGPVFGGLIAAATSVRVPLFAYGAICLATTPICLRVMRARVPAEVLAEAPTLGEAVPAPRAPAWRRLRPLFADSAYRAALIASMAGFYVSGGIQTLTSGFWVEVLGRDKGSVGLPFTALAMATLAVVWHAGAVSDRRGRKVAMVPSLAATAVVVALMGSTRSPAVLVGLMVLLGVASGYARPGPTSIVADVASDSTRAVAVAGYRTAADFGALIGPIVIGVIAQYLGYEPAFIATGAMSAVAFAAAAVARETAPRSARAAAATARP